MTGSQGSSARHGPDTRTTWIGRNTNGIRGGGLPVGGIPLRDGQGMRTASIGQIANVFGGG